MPLAALVQENSLALATHCLETGNRLVVFPHIDLVVDSVVSGRTTIRFAGIPSEQKLLVDGIEAGLVGLAAVGAEGRCQVSDPPRHDT